MRPTSAICQMDTVEAPEDFEIATCTAVPAKVKNMSEAHDGTDPAAIVISRRTLGWAGAAVLALFSGGQMATIKFADDTPDPQTVALSARVDDLARKMDQLTADGETRDARFTKILNAVLIYFLESDRQAREGRQLNSPPRSPELDRAAARLQELAEQR